MSTDEEGFSFLHRFAPSQSDAVAVHPLYRAMSMTSAGCSLQFLTTGSSLSFLCKRKNMSLRPRAQDRVLDFARLYGQKLDMSDCFDVRVDGRLLPPLLLHSGRLDASWDNPYEKKVLVELFFPLLHCVGIKDLVCDAPMEMVPKKNGMLLCLGDSIIQGMLAKRPSLALTARLSKELNREVLNQGLTGSLFNAELLQGLDTLVEAVLVSFGTNDWNILSSLSQLESNVVAFCTRLQELYPNTSVVLLTPLWRGDCDRTTTMGSFEEMKSTIENAAKAFAMVHVVDGLEISAHDSSFYEDGFLHPNAKGFAYLAEHLLPYVAYVSNKN